MSIPRPSFDALMSKNPTLQQSGRLTKFRIQARFNSRNALSEVIDLAGSKSARVTHGNDQLFKGAFKHHEPDLYESLIADDQCKVLTLPPYTGDVEVIHKSLKTMIGGFVLKYRCHSLQLYRVCQIRLYHSDNFSSQQRSKIDRSIQHRMVYKDIFSYRTLFGLIKKNFDSGIEQDLPCPVVTIEVGSDKIQLTIRPANFQIFVEHVKEYLRRERREHSAASTSSNTLEHQDRPYFDLSDSSPFKKPYSKLD